MMMTTEEKPTGEVSKMDEAVVEDTKPDNDDLNIKTETEIKMDTNHSEEETTKEPTEQEKKMEIDETQMDEYTAKAEEEVTMEIELAHQPVYNKDAEAIPSIITSINDASDETVLAKDAEISKPKEDTSPLRKEEVDQENQIDNKVESKNDVDDKEETAITPEPAEKEAVEELSGEWDVLGTDDEDDTIGGDKKRSGVWMPDKKVIIELYRKLDEEGVLELAWKCPGRRKPEVEKEITEDETEKMNRDNETKDDQIEKLEEEPTEFDFDIDSSLSTTSNKTNMASRRTPGSAQGSGKKRIARMDKIFNDMMRHKRIDEELQRVGDEQDEVTRADTTPQRPLGKFRIRKDF